MNKTKAATFVDVWLAINPEGHSRDVWVEVCRRGLQTPTLFKTKIAHFDALFTTEDTRLSDPDLFSFTYRIT